MRLTVERLRTGILVLAALLIVALLGFFALARYQGRFLSHDLPARLGVQIQQSANGYTYTQEVHGHPRFSIHAAKAVQYKNGQATLHDVSITVFGTKGDRSDRIYGSAFEFDPKTGIATATGDVAIDLAAPEAAASASSGANPSAGPNAANDAEAEKHTIHVKTSGLVFNKNTGLAQTTQQVEFHFPKAAGTAVGASYDSSKGLLILDHSVVLESSTGGNPLLVHAAHAQFLRDSRQVFLLKALCDYRTERTAADQAIVYFREDGSVEHVDAKGSVHGVNDAGQEVKTEEARILLDAQSQPVHVDLTGGVFFNSKSGNRQLRGNAVQASLQFAGGGQLSHMQLREAVSIVEDQSPLPDDPRGFSTREARASQMDIDFAPGPAVAGHPAGRSQAQKVLAVGHAMATLHTIHGGAPEQRTTINGDQLLAVLEGGSTVKTLTGSGHTTLTDLAANGSTQTSTGDSLEVHFAAVPAGAKVKAVKGGRRQAAAPATAAAAEPAAEIESAVQQGNVTMTQTPATKPSGGSTGGGSASSGSASSGLASGDPVRATAQRAEYLASEQVLHLTGAPRVNDGTIDLTARAIDYRRDTGNAVAVGDVKTTYQQQSGQQSGGQAKGSAPGALFGGQGPAHIVAAQAVLDRASGEAVFRGQARLWQGSNSVAAPVIRIQRATRSLKAQGDETAEGAAVVNSTLLAAGDGKRPPSVIRLRSRELTYSDADRVASFRGSVTAEDPNGTVRSDQADVFLLPAQQGPKTNQPQSQVDYIIATGHVELQQPGRRGSGEKLVYTERDGRFVLTGTPAAPPRLEDQSRGTVTGASLIFNSRDDSVSVSGGQSGAVTQTRVAK